jgi:hypothetical protein
MSRAFILACEAEEGKRLSIAQYVPIGSKFVETWRTDLIRVKVSGRASFARKARSTTDWDLPVLPLHSTAIYYVRFTSIC